MEISSLIPHIEALIFASDKPLTSAEVTELINSAFGFMEDKIEADQVSAAIEGIVEKYSSEFYPFEVRESGGGWQFLTKKDFHKTVAQLNGEKFLKRLSAAAIETLAIIAYKQPVTKGEIETIRGVSTDYTIQKLLEKELIIISGRNEKMPGHPLVYQTSKNFMDYFGINSPEDLPKIREVLADQLIQPTTVNESDFEQSSTMLVTDDGELIDEVPETAVEPLPADLPEEPASGETAMQVNDMNENEIESLPSEEKQSEELETPNDAQADTDDRKRDEEIDPDKESTDPAKDIES
ncbi:MAG TPA: SMC-Scp complex subunit ScpB [Chitinophagaceae bacterium]|jgi:segregation and condensation protein B|nr:SMC-Scp complex subunit ScpB [Chitinophagaceae bacterium]